MNRPLASLCLLVSLLTSITVAQTGTKKQRAERPSPRGDLKICQGVSLPDGYIIVGYVTAPACPHGAYLLKKQAPPQVSAAVANNVRQAVPPQIQGSRPRRVQSAPKLSTAPKLSAAPIL